MSLLLMGAGKAVDASPFNPTTISGLRGWWKADTGVLDASDVSISTNGTAVKTWQDQSGNARHLTQATGSLRPLYATGAKNGLPGVSFDGVDDFLSGSSPWTSVQKTTSFMVVKATGGVGVKSVLWESSDLSELRATSEVWQFESGGFKTITSGDYHTDYQVLTFVIDHLVGATSFRNGTQVGTFSGGGTIPTGGTAYLGGRTASHQATCTVLERLEYGLLTTSDRQSVEAYLKAKWGTP